MAKSIALTYLHSATPERSPECTECFRRVGIARAGTLSIEIARGLSPSEVVDDAEPVSPEDDGAVWDGQNAGGNKALERRRPAVSRT